MARRLGHILSRKKAEEALQESEKRFRKYFELGLIGMVITSPEKKFIEYNDTLCNMLGYSRKELAQLTWDTLTHPDDLEADLAQFKKVLAGEIEGYSLEKRFIRKDGGILYSEISINNMRKTDGSVDYIVALVNDLTERMQADQEKEKLESQLRQAHKREAIGTMAGGIAHDFNNILAAIIGYTEIALSDTPIESPAKFDIEQVLKASYRAKDLIKHILTFSRMPGLSEEYAQISLSPILKEVFKFQRSVIPTTIEFKTDIDKNCGLTKGDPTQIHQIIMNLCTNASHAMEENGGILGISLQKTKLSSRDLKSEENPQPGVYIQLSISDTGTGLTPELIEKIFDPYFTTKEVGKGSGMGLALVQGIIKRHGGFVKVNSKIGKGSTFNVFFPQIEEDIATERTSEEEEIPTGSEEILFVDDEEMLVDIGKKLLERLGYTVTTETNSSKAIQLFKSDPTLFDLVITDQAMPKVSGAELAKQLLQIKPDIPIILCTGHSNLVDEAKAQKIGIREYAMKPLNKRAIARLIRKVLDN